MRAHKDVAGVPCCKERKRICRREDWLVWMGLCSVSLMPSTHSVRNLEWQWLQRTLRLIRGTWTSTRSPLRLGKWGIYKEPWSMDEVLACERKRSKSLDQCLGLILLYALYSPSCSGSAPSKSSTVFFFFLAPCRLQLGGLQLDLKALRSPFSHPCNLHAY